MIVFVLLVLFQAQCGNLPLCVRNCLCARNEGSIRRKQPRVGSVVDLRRENNNSTRGARSRRSQGCTGSPWGRARLWRSLKTGEALPMKAVRVHRPLRIIKYLQHRYAFHSRALQTTSGGCRAQAHVILFMSSGLVNIYLKKKRSFHRF